MNNININIKLDELNEDYIFEAYAPEAEMTFITYDDFKSCTVIGFYYGEPDKEATKECLGKIRAEFSPN